jgi:hypothetical protein
VTRRRIHNVANGFTPPLSIELKDEDAQRVADSHDRAIREWQTSIAAALRVIPSIALASGVATTVRHGLGRPPVFMTPSVVRGAPASTGRIEEVTGTEDRSQVVVLKATGWTGTIVIDLAVL